MKTSQAKAIVNALLAKEGEGRKSLQVKAFHPSASSVGGIGTVSCTTIEGYALIFNVTNASILSLRRAESPKGQVWEWNAENSIIFDERQSTDLTTMLSHSKPRGETQGVEVVCIYQINYKGCKVGQMWNKGVTKRGIAFPKDLCINSFYDEAEAKKVAKKFEEYITKREAELTKPRKKRK